MKGKIINKPVVSIITPVYNASKFIPRLLECVKNQDIIACEHILVDDCSNDDSFTLLSEAALKNPNIKVIRLIKNSGPVVARNEAIKHATGKYLAFLDADDYWLPNKSSVQVEFMETTGAFMSFCDYRTISEDGLLVGRRLSGFNKINVSKHFMTRYIGCLTVMINLEKDPDFKFLNIDPSIRAEDFVTWSHFIKKNGPALRVPHDLARYTRVKNSRSSLNSKSALSIFFVYFKLEKTFIPKAVFYYICYIFFSLYKKSRYEPIFKSFMVDGEIAKFYLIKESR